MLGCVKQRHQVARALRCEHEQAGAARASAAAFQAEALVDDAVTPGNSDINCIADSKAQRPRSQAPTRPRRTLKGGSTHAPRTPTVAQMSVKDIDEFTSIVRRDPAGAAGAATATCDWHALIRGDRIAPPLFSSSMFLFGPRRIRRCKWPATSPRADFYDYPHFSGINLERNDAGASEDKARFRVPSDHKGIFISRGGHRADASGCRRALTGHDAPYDRARYSYAGKWVLMDSGSHPASCGPRRLPLRPIITVTNDRLIKDKKSGE
ncbi:hypothetical protein EVAR_45465_1 [Eumeta japonica]|uniref:Uncharacterized protein n=1 Tax=Eumeta variegata TaxID=151549 RepID=A0A4C1WF75_EUMVA|nr:hypothetical protein EVAR_45465_1 [Eumeta japonica]